MSWSGPRKGRGARLAAASLGLAAALGAVLAAASGGLGDPAAFAGDRDARTLRRFGRKYGDPGVYLPPYEAPGDVSTLPWWADPDLVQGPQTWIDAGGFVICGDGNTYRTLDAMGFGEPFPGGGYYVVDGASGLPVTEEGLDWLSAALPGACIEPDWWMRPPEGSQSNRIVVGSELGRSYPTQPALGRIAADAAHAVATGRGVVVAVLDTGVDVSHPVFAGRILPGTDLVDLDDLPEEFADGLDTDFDGEADESHGHGTLVAGLVHVVAPDAWILPVRVLDSDGQGTASSVAAGIRFARESGASVINLSLGMRQRAEIVADEIRLAIAAGVVVVAATGNDGRRFADFPASLPGVVAVTASGRGGHRARFANGAGTPSVAAPGRDLVGPYPGETWGRASGTSFAAALVSGGAALVRERWPGLDGAEASERLTESRRLRLPPLLR